MYVCMSKIFCYFMNWLYAEGTRCRFSEADRQYKKFSVCIQIIFTCTSLVLFRKQSYDGLLSFAQLWYELKFLKVFWCGLLRKIHTLVLHSSLPNKNI